jgi:hypothetical protein
MGLLLTHLITQTPLIAIIIITKQILIHNMFRVGIRIFLLSKFHHIIKQHTHTGLAMILAVIINKVYQSKQEQMPISQLALGLQVTLVLQDWLVQTAQTVMHLQQPMLTQLQELMAQQLQELLVNQVVVVV